MATFPIHPGSTHSSVLEGIRDPENRLAWERFYGQYAPYVRALGRRYGLRHADAEDVVQTVFAEIAGRIGRFEYDRAKGSFHAWLARAAWFRIVDLRKGNERREAREVAMPDVEPAAPDAFGEMAEEEWRGHVLRLPEKAEGVVRIFECSASLWSGCGRGRRGGSSRFSTRPPSRGGPRRRR